jgi:phage terminase small subunit
MALTPKQTRFVAEYLANGLNATKAAISAGYSAKTAESQGSRLLSNVKVAAELGKKAEKALDKLDFSVERVMKEVARLAFFDPANLFEADGSLKSIKDIDEDTRSVIAGLEVTELFGGDGEQKHAYGLLKKVKISDRRAALDMLMRYHSLYKDKVEHTGAVTLQHDIPRPKRT